jgi:hypothetical protein
MQQDRVRRLGDLREGAHPAQHLLSMIVGVAAGRDKAKGAAFGRARPTWQRAAPVPEGRLEVLVDETISRAGSSVTRKRFHRSSSEDIAESSAAQSARLRPASSADNPQRYIVTTVTTRFLENVFMLRKDMRWP